MLVVGWVEGGKELIYIVVLFKEDLTKASHNFIVTKDIRRRILCSTPNPSIRVSTIL